MGRAVWMGFSMLAVSAACGSGEAPAVRAVVRDSAGIAIVENRTPLAADSIALRIDSVPAVEIGGADDPHSEFGRIAGAIRLPDGGFAVADGGNQELKLFDSTGAWRRLAGGKGSGPGEFEQLGGSSGWVTIVWRPTIGTTVASRSSRSGETWLAKRRCRTSVWTQAS